MSKIKKIFEKLGNSFSYPNGEERPKITPDEMELMSYKRQEYLDNVKNELRSYRKRNRYLNTPEDRQILCKSTIFNESNLPKRKKINILKSKSRFR